MTPLHLLLTALCLVLLVLTSLPPDRLVASYSNATTALSLVAAVAILTGLLILFAPTS